MVLRRLTVYLALLTGMLVAAWHPLMAMEAAGGERAESRSAPVGLPVSTPVPIGRWSTAEHAARAPLMIPGATGHGTPWLMERLPQERRHPSWHRGVSRRLPRGLGGQLSLPTDSGSISTPFLLYSQRLEWHVLPLPLVHGVGGRSARPRAPPR